MYFGTGDKMFPLSIHASGRYLVTGNGVPFLLWGDTPWMLANQLTDAQIKLYLDDRKARGYSAILIEAPGMFFTSQTPSTNNVDGEAPFTTMSPVNFASLNNTFWNRVDYIVNQCLVRGMLVIFNPAYLGFGGGSEGWMADVTAESAGDLQTYGATIATRYTQGNIIWCLGGDYAGTTTERDKQWNIVTGIRTVRTTDLITAHNAPGSPAFTAWDGYTGYNLNTAYPSNVDQVFSDCDTEYARSPAVPFIMLEARYEQENAADDADLIRQSACAMLSGACGCFFGNNPIWHFESPETLFSYTGTWFSNLRSNGNTHQSNMIGLWRSYNWHLLEPRTDTSLITTSLGTGDTRIVGSMASDDSFAFIWTPSQNFTVAMTNFAPSSVRGRWFNPTDASFTASAGSPYSNTGTQAFTAPGDRILVLDAA